MNILAFVFTVLAVPLIANVYAASVKDPVPSGLLKPISALWFLCGRLGMCRFR